jgi:flagellar hook-associated protein 2
MNVSSLTSSSSTSATNASYSSKGLSGLMSGMDTETMVKEMLSGTQTKIDSANQKKQQLEWKQDSYRNCITDINTLYQSYFNASYDADLTNNLASAKFFNQKASTVTGSGVKIISTDYSAAAGDMTVAVEQLATKASLASTTTMSGDRTITGTNNIDLSKYNKTVTLKVNGTEVGVNLNNATTADEVAQAFNTALQDKGVTAKVYDGRLRLVGAKDTTFSVDTDKSTSYGLSMSGLGVPSTSEIKDTNGTVTGSMFQGTAMKPADGPSIQVSLDGVTKTISLNDIAGADGTITMDSLQAGLQKQLRSAFGTFVQVRTVGAGADQKLQLYMDDGNAATTDDGKGHELVVYGADAQAMGIKPGTSSCISTSTKLGELNGIAGSSYAFTINGQEFSFDSNTTLNDMITAINDSSAGVKISYSSLSDTFAMTSASTGAQYGIEIKQSQGNVMTALFGDQIHAANTVATNQLTTGTITGTGLAADYTTTAASLSMKVNGTSYTFTLSAKENGEAYTKDEVESSFNTWLKDTFGTGAGDAQNISYADGKLNIANGFAVSFTATTVDLESASAVATAKGSDDLALAFGFNRTATSNASTTEDTLLSAVTQLNGTGASFGLKAGASLADAKLSDITSIDGIAVTYQDGRFQLSGDGSTPIDLSGSATLQALFDGATSVAVSNGETATAAGQDAIADINGVKISRSSNTFTIDGVTMQLTQVSEKDESGKYKEATIATDQNTDKIVDALKSFVKDYNAMVDKFQGLLKEDADFQKYAPLTDAQKKEMSDSEVESWTKKAKTGLLRNDDTLESFLSNMRGALYTKSSSSSLALYDIGIATYDKTGKLEIDESALRNALSSDPEGVANLFTDKTDGLAKKLMQAMDDTAKLSSGSPGLLVSLAGAKDLASTLKNNTLYKQMLELDNKVDQLKDRYENEKDRYWKMFTAMENAMTNFNTQSSMLNSYFSN